MAKKLKISLPSGHACPKCGHELWLTENVSVICSNPNCMYHASIGDVMSNLFDLI